MDTFCVEPWRQIHFDSEGRVGPCCFFVRNDNVDIDNVKKLMLNNDPVMGCRSCYDQEQRGAFSMRQQSNKTYKFVDELTELFITLGNTCNMACIFCNPSRSSKLASWMRNNPGTDWVNVYQQTQLADVVKDNTWFDNTDFSKIIEEHPIKTIHLNGGEPFAVKKVAQLLKELPKNLEIIITTNGSWSIEHLDLLSEFDSVLLEVSIDAVGSVYDIIRFPATWKQTEIQLAMLDNYNFNVLYSIVPNCINALNLGAFAKRFTNKKILVNYLNGQKHLGLWNIPQHIKPLVEEQIDQLEVEQVGLKSELKQEPQMLDRLEQLVGHWEETRNQKIWETIGWRLYEENTNNR